MIHVITLQCICGYFLGCYIAYKWMNIYLFTDDQKDSMIHDMFMVIGVPLSWITVLAMLLTAAFFTLKNYVETFYR